MKIHIRGGTPNTKVLVRSIAEFCTKRLLGGRLAKNVKIKFYLSDTCAKRHQVLGSCLWDDNPINPRVFSIHIDTKQPMIGILKTVAHELTHMKQFARGELASTVSRDAHLKWCGKKVNLEKTHYYDLPWEIEAHGREEGLLNLWIESENIFKKDLKK